MESTEVFVFGSNLAGRHGAGAALYASKNHGAVYGQGWGMQGESYGIPTKDENLNILDLPDIHFHVLKFLDYAYHNPHKIFHVTKIGCGLAGYKPTDIAWMFKKHSSNVKLPEEFIEAC